MNQREGLPKRKASLPEARQQDPRFHRTAGLIAYPTPRGMIDSRCKQVSRLGLILLAHLPAFAVASIHAFVRFTVTGIARNFHPRSCDAPVYGAPRIAAQIHRLFICPDYYSISGPGPSMTSRSLMRHEPIFPVKPPVLPHIGHHSAYSPRIGWPYLKSAALIS